MTNLTFNQNALFQCLLDDEMKKLVQEQIMSASIDAFAWGVLAGIIMTIITLYILRRMKII